MFCIERSPGSPNYVSTLPHPVEEEGRGALPRGMPRGGIKIDDKGRVRRRALFEGDEVAVEGGSDEEEDVDEEEEEHDGVAVKAHDEEEEDEDDGEEDDEEEEDEEGEGYVFSHSYRYMHTQNPTLSCPP